MKYDNVLTHYVLYCHNIENFLTNQNKSSTLSKIFIMKKFENLSQSRDYVQSLPIGQMIELCSKLLIERQTEKVFLTQEQFEAFFQGSRIKGCSRDKGKEQKDRVIVTICD